jgi:type II secretory pathway pseudopilin PulG
MINNKRAQEEMVGFALIIIIVAIILLVFLGLFLTRPNNQSIQSYEAESFVQSMLQFSTQCQNYNYGYISVQDLIFMCNSGTPCSDNEDSCAILNSTLTGILSHSWTIGQGSVIKGYLLNITSSNGEIFTISAGNITSSSEGTSQTLPPQNGISIGIFFNGYY